MRKSIEVLERADVIYTTDDNGQVIGWMVLDGGQVVRLTRSDAVAALDGRRARAAIAQSLSARV